MRVCFLNHDLNDNMGAGRFCLALLAALKNEMPGLEYEVLTHNNFLPNKKIRLIFVLLKIRAIFKKYDIIHALDGWPYGVIAAIASWGLKKKFIITAIGTGAIQPLYSWWRRPLMIWAYRRADKVVAVSNNTKREILKVIPDLSASRRIEVINHGVDAAKFQISNPKSKINSKFQIQNYKPYILSVGALKKRKGYEYSISAFAKISSKFSNLKYVIVGNGLEREALKLQITNYKLQNKIIFLDNLNEEDLIILYQNAEFFILLPQDINKDVEGFGLVFLEAAAAGLPVIGTKDSGVEDAMLDGKNGILVVQEDSNQAAEAMVKFLSNLELKKAFSQESLSFAKTMNWEKVAERYGSIYHSVYGSR